MNKSSGLSFFAIVGLSALIVIGKFHYDRQIAVLKTTHQTTISAIAIKAKAQSDAVNDRMKTAQRHAAELDKKHWEKYSDAQDENQRLRAALASGDKRLRIASADLATCELSTNRTALASSVGDATEIRFTAKAGFIIQDIRNGINSDQAKLDYLQQWIIEVEKQCRIAN